MIETEEIKARARNALRDVTVYGVYAVIFVLRAPARSQKSRIAAGG